MIEQEKPNVPEFIREALAHAMHKEFDRLKEEFINELERNRSQIIAGLMIHVMDRTTMHDLGRHIEIRIEKNMPSQN